MESAVNWKRFLALGCALWIAGCGGEWSENDRAEFMSSCEGTIRLDDENLRETICTCWLERAQVKYTLQEVNSGNQEIQAAFVAFGKACSAEQGIRAHLPGEG